ncbi:MAG: recombinase family protein [Sedimentisphaeraceae bacterium JB056]
MKKEVRCAVYTRKSTEEGLNQEFNSLDAQREAAESYITSQKSQGWKCLPEYYDDGGFTGGNMDRPALKRLLDDVDNKRIDCVVVYKVDRLSRSLLDFTKILERFEKQDVSFVSVTQQFNSATSMGRLTLNVLLSFAQFEREVISERTRDKIAMARRRGKYTGGRPVLGYDIENSKLKINSNEAETVRKIFNTYLQTGGLVSTIKKLDELGIHNKTWVTKKGILQKGKEFNKNTLRCLLTNPLYVGKVRYKESLFNGEHQGIIDSALFEEVGRKLSKSSGSLNREPNKNGGILKGLLRCVHCRSTMTHSFTKKENRRYRYYICRNAQSKGWASCPHPSLPAEQIEDFVINEIKDIGLDDELIELVTANISKSIESDIAAAKERIKTDKNELKSLKQRLLKQSEPSQLAAIGEMILLCEQRIEESFAKIKELEKTEISSEDIRTACRKFDPVWTTLSIQQQWQMLGLLIKRIDFDGPGNNIDIVFYPEGLKQISGRQA